MSFFEAHPFLGWVLTGALSFELYGTITAILFNYTPPLSYIALGVTWNLISIMLVAYGLVGGLLAAMGYAHYKVVGFSTNGLSTNIFCGFWGAIIGAILGYLLVYLPPIAEADLQSAILRCAVGGISGLLGGAFLAWRSIAKFAPNPFS
jgi:prolipoprotein diacylglyceryltransferase